MDTMQDASTVALDFLNTAQKTAQMRWYGLSGDYTQKYLERSING